MTLVLSITSVLVVPACDACDVPGGERQLIADGAFVVTSAPPSCRGVTMSSLLFVLGDDHQAVASNIDADKDSFEFSFTSAGGMVCGAAPLELALAVRGQDLKTDPHNALSPGTQVSLACVGNGPMASARIAAAATSTTGSLDITFDLKIDDGTTLVEIIGTQAYATEDNPPRSCL